MELETTSVGETGQSQKLPQSAHINLSHTTGTVHLIGIGGIGMSALARLLLARGVAVSGSDRAENTTSAELAELGARISIGHEANNIDGASSVVVSTAITQDNPELQEAKRRNLPVYHRSQLLSALTDGHKLIAVSGTHGKTTTTGMVAQVLLDASYEPTVVVGGISPRIGSNALLGTGDYFVAEADESDGTHATMPSYIAVITNIEADHLENYPGGIEQIRESMISFANNSQWGTVLCTDDSGCKLIRPSLQGHVVTYGKADSSPAADYTYESAAGFGLKVFKSGSCLGEITLTVPGEHNKLDALAACVVGLELGVDFTTCAEALGSYTAVARRFQILGQESGVVVVDDYAHHPTEVAATLQGALHYLNLKKTQTPSRVVAVFQPHQPGRLRDLWEEFSRAFDQSDLTLVADIYVARGSNIAGIDSQTFVKTLQQRNLNAHYLPGQTAELPEKIVGYLKAGDLVLTIGAGDITKVGWEILRLLKQGHSDGRAG